MDCNRLLDKYEVLVALEIVSDRASLLEYAKELCVTLTYLWDMAVLTCLQ